MKASNIKLYITARDADGKIVSEICKDNDLYLWNFVVMVTHWIKRWNKTTDPATYSFTDIGGGMRTITPGDHIYSDSNSINNSYAGAWLNTLKAVIGAGSTLPTIYDYKLEQQLAETTPGDVALIADAKTSVIKHIFSATFPMGDEVICSEIGLRMKSMANLGGGWFDILITRDTFPAVTVPAGGTIAVVFEFWWNEMPPSPDDD